MDTEAREVAIEVLRQLGRGQSVGATSMLLGMYNIGYEKIGSVVHTTFKFKGCKEHNFCRIVLEADDTYTVSLYHWNAKSMTLSEPKVYTDVYNDSLAEIFESETGLYTILV